jgi:hypothetical protein
MTSRGDRKEEFKRIEARKKKRRDKKGEGTRKMRG